MRYATMLRGINVSGHRKVSMKELVALYEQLGYSDVESYVQSGNIVFGAGRRSAPAAAKELESAIEGEFGYPDVDVIIRSAKDLEKILGSNPFLKDADPKTLHVTFFKTKPAAGKPDDGSWKPDEFEVAGLEAYVLCPNGYGRTKLNNGFFEKRFDARATTRNWKTVNTLAELTAG